MNLLLVLCGCILLLKAIQLCQTAFRFQQLSFAPKRAEWVDRKTLPEFEQQLLMPRVAELESLGFEFSHAEARDGMTEANQEPRRNYLVFCQKQSEQSEREVLATLTLSLLPELSQTTIVCFSSSFADGYVLRTSAMPGDFDLLFSEKNSEKGDARAFYFQPITVLLTTHQERLQKAKSEHGKTLLLPEEPERIIQFELEETERILAFARAKKTLKSCATDRLSLHGAFTIAFFAIREMNRRQREFKKIKRFGEDAQVSLPIDAEVEAFQALSRMRNQGAWSTRGKAIALLCSFCLFAVSFLQLFELRGVLLLGGVLLFHEAGHIVGMRYFGFRDLKILFLPFIGAVALGKRQNVPAYQKVIVALLGPLPGIFLGLILMVGLSQFPDYSNNFLNELLWTLLAINFFNLLPLMPLDGGQVLHALFFSRYPFLEAAFSIVGALFLLLSGALTDSSLLILLSIMLLAGTKEQIRRSRLLLTLRKRMRAESESLDEQGVLRQIFSHLAERPKSARQSENFASRYQTAEYLLNHCRASQPNVWQSLTLVVLYLGCLLVVPVAVWKFHRHVSPVNAAEEAEPAPASTKSPGFREAKPEELQELSAVRV